jgi:hypothetical protein
MMKWGEEGVGVEVEVTPNTEQGTPNDEVGEMGQGTRDWILEAPSFAEATAGKGYWMYGCEE